MEVMGVGGGGGSEAVHSASVWPSAALAFSRRHCQPPSPTLPLDLDLDLHPATKGFSFGVGGYGLI